MQIWLRSCCASALNLTHGWTLSRASNPNFILRATCFSVFAILSTISAGAGSPGFPQLVLPLLPRLCNPSNPIPFRSAFFVSHKGDSCWHHAMVEYGPIPAWQYWPRLPIIPTYSECFIPFSIAADDRLRCKHHQHIDNGCPCFVLKPFCGKTMGVRGFSERRTANAG
jgi:hypothetical protein